MSSIEGPENTGTTLIALKDVMTQENLIAPAIQEIQFRKYGDARDKTTVGFERANWEVACANKTSRSNRYYKGQLVDFRVNLQHFKAYGPGVYLFFLFMWEVSILFLIMSLISIMPIVYNYVTGTGLSNVGETLAVYLAKMSIGNHRGVSSTVATPEIVAQSTSQKLFNVIPDLVNVGLFFIFYLYWDRKSRKLTEEIKQQIRLPSYSTVELIEFPNQATDKQIENYMSRFGKVKEIAPVRNYQEMIYLSKKVYELSLKHKQIRLTTEESEQPTKEMEKIVKQIQQLYEELQMAEKHQETKVLKYYVTYETPAERQQVVQAFKRYSGCCKCDREQPQERFYLQNQICSVIPCEEQPGGILWENVHICWKTRWIRYSLQLLFLITILAGGFLLISLLNVTTPPLSNDNLDTSTYNQTTILSVSDIGILESWCLKNSYTSTEVTVKCAPYVNMYYMKLGITVVISLVALVIKFLMRIVVIFLARFQRYKTHTQQSRDMVANLFVMYTVTTVIIILLFQANVFRISFKGILNSILTSQYLKHNLGLLVEYNDFSVNWFVDIGYQIWLTWIIVAVSPHTFYPIVHLLMQKFGEYFGRKEILQKNMQARIQAEQFQIEDHYANVLMILFVCMMFCGGMPIMIPISFIGLATRYVYFKYTFLRFCRVPKTVSESINNRILHILPFCVFFHFAFSIWMFGVDKIFAYQQNWMSSLINGSDTGDFVRSLTMVLNRISATWYMTIFFGITIFIVVCKTFFFGLITRFFWKRDKTVPKTVLDEDSIIRSERSLTTSYRLEANPDYFQILAIMNPKTIKKICQN